MSLDVNSLLRNAFFISCNERRQAILKAWFRRFKFTSEPVIFHAYSNKSLSGPYNCTLSHISVLKMAKAMKLPYVVIFEDDAYPCIDMPGRMAIACSNVPSDADILILGYSKVKGCAKPTDISDEIVKTSGKNVYGSHAYVVFDKAYDKMLDYYQRNDKIPADGMFSNKACNVYFIKYPLFIQYSSEKSMNGHSGYIFYGNSATPPIGYCGMG